MEAPAQVVEYLKRREGWRERVYLDTLGNPTAGMGHLLTPSERARFAVGDAVPAETLARWTQADADGAYGAARQQAIELGLGSDSGFTTVLTSVNFQLGTYWRRKFPQTWEAMQRREWATAARMVMESRWAAQTPTRARDFSQALLAQAEKGSGHGRTFAGLAVAAGLALLLGAVAMAWNPRN